jgi:hypothetical protein
LEHYDEIYYDCMNDFKNGVRVAWFLHAIFGFWRSGFVKTFGGGYVEGLFIGGSGGGRTGLLSF